MQQRTIGVDVGATRTKLVVLEASTTVVDKREVDSDFAAPEALVEAVVDFSKPWLDLPDRERPSGLGVAVPGLVERRDGRVLRAPNLDVLDGFAVGIALEVATGVRVFVDNDAHAAGLAEVSLGAAAGCQSAVCLTIGTGVGGAIIQNGRLWRGHGGLAGELGRLILNSDGDRYFEEEVGAGAVVAAYAAFAGAADVDIDAAAVAALAAAGDAAARQALARCGRHLGVGLAVLVNLLNPERIVIGGGVAGAGELLLGPARIEGERRSWGEAWRQCEIVPARLGAAAGSIGAALLCDHDKGTEGE